MGDMDPDAVRRRLNRRPASLGLRFGESSEGRSVPGAAGTLEVAPRAAAVRWGIDLFDLVDDPEADAHRAALVGGVPQGVVVLRRGDDRASRTPARRATDSSPGVLELPVFPPSSSNRVVGSTDARSSSTPWVLDLPGAEVDPATVRTAASDGAVGLRVRAGLRSAGALGALGSLAAPLGLSLLVIDPFEGGRFDGRFLDVATAGVLPPSAGGPEAVQAYFAPVLRYNFLAIARRRTLAQAVLHYLSGVDGVAGIALPADAAPERLGAWVGFRSAPELTPEDRSRILAESGRGDGVSEDAAS